jgi:hypothetical protein
MRFLRIISAFFHKLMVKYIISRACNGNCHFARMDKLSEKGLFCKCVTKNVANEKCLRQKKPTDGI